MTQPVIWHNPRCSKSRQTLAILVDGGFEPTVRKYLEDTPTVEEIQNALASLGITASGLIRKGESQYKDLNLKSAAEIGLINAMTEHPILIERPVVFHKGKAAIGRPPESVRGIL